MTRRTWWGATGAILVLVAAAIIWGANGRADDAAAPPSSVPAPTSTSASASPSSQPSPSPVPVPAATTSPGEVSSDASTLVTPFVKADAAARQTPAQPLALTEVSTGAALDDLQIAVEELQAGGLTQIGEPVLVSAVVTSDELEATPPTATVLVCLDYSKVDLVNSAGESAKDATAPQRVSTILRLVKQDDSWLVADRTFPDDPSC